MLAPEKSYWGEEWAEHLWSVSLRLRSSADSITFHVNPIVPNVICSLRNHSDTVHQQNEGLVFILKQLGLHFKRLGGKVLTPHFAGPLFRDPTEEYQEDLLKKESSTYIQEQISTATIQEPHPVVFRVGVGRLLVLGVLLFLLEY